MQSKRKSELAVLIQRQVAALAQQVHGDRQQRAQVWHPRAAELMQWRSRPEVGSSGGHNHPINRYTEPLFATRGRLVRAADPTRGRHLQCISRSEVDLVT